MDNMDNITIETIVALFQKTTDKKRVKQIKDELLHQQFPEDILVEPSVQEELNKIVERLLKEDQKRSKESFLIKDKSGRYSKRKEHKLVDGVLPTIGSNYIGKAGECAVISELMFRGYNANTMLLDEGIDIIATKDNIYYYIQVKTTYIKDGRLYVKIKKERFDKYIENQIRYVIVGRYGKEGDLRNIFFVFDPNTIERFARYEQCINESDEALNIKIEFEPRTGKYFMYDNNKRADVSYYINKFL
jgi:hypothetical protein